MSRYPGLAVVCTLVCCLTGCTKPDTVRIFRSPTSSVHLTFETSDGLGPVSADEMRLYAHFNQDGHSTKQLILDGEELTISKIIWSGPTSVTICLSGGITDTFRNEATLIIGRSEKKIHSYLREDC